MSGQRVQAEPSYWGTRIRSIRVPDCRWDRARQRAAAEGTTISEEINAYLEAYGSGQPATVREGHPEWATGPVSREGWYPEDGG